MKQWKCTTCGYPHEGEHPPEQCPACRADSSKFDVIAAEGAALSAPPVEEGRNGDTDPTGFQRVYRFLARWMTRLHGHPVSVHIPNGVLPAAVMFLALGTLFQSSALTLAAFYNLALVVVSMPVVIFSGCIDWKTRFGAHLTRLFFAKMVCGGVASATGLVLVLWRLADPLVAGPHSGNQTAFFMGHMVMLGAVVIAGYLGGRVVFKNQAPPSA